VSDQIWIGIAEAASKGGDMTYTFHVVITREAGSWRAKCPALESYGATTRGNTREEALTHIHSVLVMILVKLEHEGAAIPPDHVFPDSISIAVEL
jgi:predicted RNase H-like HicB family nuclease